MLLKIAKSEVKKGEKETTSTESKRGSMKDVKYTKTQENVLLVIKGALSLSKPNAWKGTQNEGNVAFPLWARIKSDGAFTNLEDESDKMKQMVKLAKASIEDIKSGKYSQNVKSLLDEFLQLKSKRGGKKFNASALDDIKW